MKTADFFVSQMEGERESWKAAHNLAMQCREVEDHLRKGVSLFYFYRLADESWSKKVQLGAEKFDAARVRQIRDEYEAWLVPCDYVLEVLSQAEQNFQVEHAEQFRACVRLARKLVGIDVEELIKSVEQAEKREVKPLTDEIWDVTLSDRGDAKGPP